MATLSDNTIIGINDTDAHFRAQCKFVHDTFALGWTQTADTGQASVAAIVRPTITNTSMGYEIWRMNDSLQGTAPVFLKAEYGSGTSSANQFSFWFTIGTGSDGAGGITGIKLPRTQTGGGNSAATNLHQCFGSADTARLTLAMILSVAATQSWWFAIERTKDSTGADTATGLILAYGGGAFTPAHRSVVVPFSATAPVPEIGLQCILSTNNPTAYTGDQGVGLMIPMLGTAIQPGLNVCITMQNDFAQWAQPSFPLYGATHTYQQCGNFLTTLRPSSNGAQDNATRLLLRYE